jgi:hypothetical protein
MLPVLYRDAIRAQLRIEIVPTLIFAQVFQALTLCAHCCHSLHSGIGPVTRGESGIAFLGHARLKIGEGFSCSASLNLNLLHEMLALFARARHGPAKRKNFTFNLCQRITIAALTYGCFARRDQHAYLANGILHLLTSYLLLAMCPLIAIETITGARA